MLIVEAAGVEPDNSTEITQLIDSENDRIGMISGNAKSSRESYVLTNTERSHAIQVALVTRHSSVIINATAIPSHTSLKR
jgi:hypothetical protein